MEIIKFMRNVKVTEKELKKILLRYAVDELEEYGEIDIFPKINREIPKEYSDLEEFVAETILGFTPAPDLKIYLKRVENFPIEIELFEQGSNDGYHGGGAYKRVVDGRFETKEVENFENQYTYGYYEKGLLYPNQEGFAVVKSSSSWDGKYEYYVYYTNEEVFLKKMEQWNERRKKIIEEIKKELEKEIEELINEVDKECGINDILKACNSIEYIYSEEVQDHSNFEYKECEIIVYLNKKKFPVCLEIEYSSSENCYRYNRYIEEIEISGKHYKHETIVNHECSWVEMGYGGGNYLEEWDEVMENYKENRKLFWIVNRIIAYRREEDAIKRIESFCYPKKGIDILDRHTSTKIILNPHTNIKFV